MKRSSWLSPMLKKAICLPSGDTLLGTRLLLRVSSRDGIPARRATGANGTATGLPDPTRDLSANLAPSFEKLGSEGDACTPAVTVSGTPMIFPLKSSPAIRQRFIAAPRSLEK